MPPAVQALGIAMHIRSEPEADPAALAYDMISLLRSVRTRAREAGQNGAGELANPAGALGHVAGYVGGYEFPTMSPRLPRT